MKFYDAVISLGQYCITSTALRRCNLQLESMVFDWSAGIMLEQCGLGGLEGKVDLICNDFKDFFNLGDLENRGNNLENDTYNLWIVNRRTGLQYKHDFPANEPVEERYKVVKEQYMRRVKRLYDTIHMSGGGGICFVFMARDTGFSDELLLAQQEKLQKKFPDKKIDFLYIMHNEKYGIDEYNAYYMTPQVYRIDCNFTYATDPKYPESWNGNTKLYYPLLRDYCFTPVTFKSLNSQVMTLNKDIVALRHSLSEISRRPTSLQQIFSVRNEGHYKVWRVFGVKMKFRRRNVNER